jgi:hypothetical protein
MDDTDQLFATVEVRERLQSKSILLSWVELY